jgi:hypothetical protein
MAREQAMREKRVRKQEKKEDKKQAALEAASGESPASPERADETPS